MWKEQEVTINSKKINAQVNNSNSEIEVELPYDKSLVRAESITIDGKSHSISMITDTGERNETLVFKIKGDDNEHKSPQGGKTTKLSK